jgi:hypothetical protein
MNWLERARREIPKSARRRTANSAERTLTAVMAVRRRLLESESAREAYEERAAIMEFDGGLSRDDAKC